MAFCRGFPYSTIASHCPSPPNFHWPFYNWKRHASRWQRYSFFYACMDPQKFLLPLRRTMLNVQMYRANYTAFGNKTTSKQTCYLMIDRFVKLESCNKFVLKSFFFPQMLCMDLCIRVQHASYIIGMLKNSNDGVKAEMLGNVAYRIDDRNLCPFIYS